MMIEDVARYALGSVRGHRQRSILTMLGIVIGISSVILLTSIGEGARRFILTEFTQFGTNLISVNPGRIETTGMPGAIGGVTHPLTLADAEALSRIPGIEAVVPTTMGTAGVEHDGRTRHVYVYGVTAEAPGAWRMAVRSGRFLPAGDPRHASPVAVLGPTLKRELFAESPALGQFVRIGGQRFRVVGVMESKGQFLGFDIDDAVYIPVSLAMPLFNRDDLQEIDVVASNSSVIDSIAARLRRELIRRHAGNEDFTVTTQTGMLETLDRVLRVVSLAVIGIGAISLLVGAIGILTMMWIAVHERTAEIGLARALGATPRQILWLFLAEALLLSTAGGVVGLAIGVGIAQLVHLLLPALPVQTPPLFVALALAISFVVGLLSGILPAGRAARLAPVTALAAA